MDVGPMMILWLSSALLAVTILRYISTVRSRSTGSDGLPPGPTPLPLVGNLLALGPELHLSLYNLSKTHGPLMTLALGATTTIVVTSRDAAREVLQRKDQSFAGRSIRDTVRGAAHHEASLAWLPANPRWRSLRRFCNTHLFSAQRLAATQEVRRERVRRLLGHLRRAAGLEVDVGRAAFGMIINLVSNTLFSADVVDMDDESPQEFKELMSSFMQEVGTANVSDVFPAVRVLDLQGKRRRVGRIIEKLHRVFDGFVDRRREENVEARAKRGADGDFLDAILEWELEESNPKANQHAMRCVFADLFFGGTDTTSTTVEWAMAELVRNPTAMQAIRAELAQHIPAGKEMEESDIGGLPYLQSVVKETLRLHPAAPLLLPHLNESAVELCGYTIPKGSQILINAWAIAREESVWGDGERFRPERFVGSEVDYRGQDFELIPFGAGRRMCPGLQLAHRMLCMIVGSMVREFEWRLPEGTDDVDMSEKFGITLAMATPLRLVPVPVQS